MSNSCLCLCITACCSPWLCEAVRLEWETQATQRNPSLSSASILTVAMTTEDFRWARMHGGHVMLLECVAVFFVTGKEMVRNCHGVWWYSPLPVSGEISSTVCLKSIVLIFIKLFKDSYNSLLGLSHRLCCKMQIKWSKEIGNFTRLDQKTVHLIIIYSFCIEKENVALFVCWII